MPDFSEELLVRKKKDETVRENEKPKQKNVHFFVRLMLNGAKQKKTKTKGYYICVAIICV